MPKVRLSTMISDIKGKSNGSVFSKNSGGVYFRNNPNGGGKKSANWDKQKNKFASLASSWRGLTNEDQTAWNNATTNYPTTDAFGQTRIPSGYELYMRLNGHMNAVGLPSFTVPNTPRVTPSIGAVSVEYPEFWQLNPKACFACFDLNGVTTANRLTSLAYLEAMQPYAGRVYSFRFWLENLAYNVASMITEYEIFTVREASGDNINFKIINLNQLNPTLRVELYNSGTIWFFDYSVNSAFIANPNHIIIDFGAGGFANLRLFVNGIQVTLDEGGTIGTNLPLADYQMFFGSDDQNPYYKLFLSDFRLYNNSITTDEALLISQGYVLESEDVLIDMITLDGDEFMNYGALGAAFNMASSDFTISLKSIIPISFGLIPLFQIDVQNTGLPDLYLNIYCSPPISNGKTGSFSNFKLLGSYAWDTNLNFVVQQEIKNLFGNIPANCEVRFKIDILDATTGDLVSKNIQPPRKTPRFKAGTDITEKVN